MTVPSGTTYNGQPSGTYNCNIGSWTTAGSANGNSSFQVQITMDGLPTIGPYWYETDGNGNATVNIFQMVTTPAGQHIFAVQFITGTSHPFYSLARSFQLVELG